MHRKNRGKVNFFYFSCMRHEKFHLFIKLKNQNNVSRMKLFSNNPRTGTLTNPDSQTLQSGVCEIWQQIIIIKLESKQNSISLWKTYGKVITVHVMRKTLAPTFDYQQNSCLTHIQNTYFGRKVKEICILKATLLRRSL